jgi:hypothetical protein
VGDLRADDNTVDRILAGLVDPVDAPPGYEAAVMLLAAARGVPVPAPRRVAGPARRVTPRVRPPLSILAAAVVLGGCSGAAFAAGLPAAASSTARGVLQSLGVASGPRTHPVSGPSETDRMTVSTHPPATAATEPAGVARAPAAGNRRSHTRRDARRKHHGHGAAISALAHSTTGTAGAKGARISAAASGGKSHAGGHGHNGKSHAGELGHNGKSEASHGHGRRPQGPR